MSIFWRGLPLTRRRMQEDIKKSRFSTKSRFISELMQDRDKSHSNYGKRIGNHTKAIESYQFNWMTLSDLFKVTMIQRQITWKWYNIQLYLQWPTNKKSYDLSIGSIFNDLERPLPLVSKSRRFLTLNISEKVRHTVSMKILIGTNTRPTQQCHFEWPWVTKQNIQWHEVSRGLSATAELLVCYSFQVHAIKRRCWSDLLYLTKVRQLW